MTSASKTGICPICEIERIVYPCEGCSQKFCLAHFEQHRTDLSDELDQIESDQNELRRNLHDQRSNPMKHPLMKKIDQWERKSIERVRQVAQQCRYELVRQSDRLVLHKQAQLDNFARQIKEIRLANEFTDIDLNHLRKKLDKLRKELDQSTKISLMEQATTSSCISNISLVVSSVGKGNHADHCRVHSKEDVLLFFDQCLDIRWKQSGKTIAGGNGHGDRSNQFQNPLSICFDRQDQSIYIADCFNYRIVKWKSNATDGQIVAGGNGPGNQTDRVDHPTDVVLDPRDKSLIIADSKNRRVVRWSREKNECQAVIISNIDCFGLAIHEDGTLYVSNCETNEVRRWKAGETKGTLVAGGNGQGKHRTQLDFPAYLFVDVEHNLYVSDRNNHRVMKWKKGAREGIVVAGGNDQGEKVTQLFRPQGVVVDQLGQIYVADCWNHRVMRWSEGIAEGIVVVGGTDKGDKPEQLNCPVGLALDGKGNLYVVDNGNNRIQKFEIEQNEKKT